MIYKSYLWYKARFGGETKRFYVWNVETLILEAYKSEGDSEPFRVYNLNSMESIHSVASDVDSEVRKKIPFSRSK